MSGRIAVYMILAFAFLTFGGLSFIQKFAVQIPVHEILISESTPDRMLSISQNEEKTFERKDPEVPDSENTLKPHILQEEMKLIQACYGNLGLDHSKSRTILFFGATKGVPHIITSKVIKNSESENDSGYATIDFSDAHQNALRKNGVLAIHGTFPEIKSSDEKLNEHQFDNLIDEATQTCMGEDALNPSQTREVEAFQNEILNSATAFVQLDKNFETENLKIIIYYELNGIIRTFEWSPAITKTI